MHCQCFIVAIAVLACFANAGKQPLPSPLDSIPLFADQRGQDCAVRTFSGTDTLLPEVFGSTNAYCTGSNGCQWKWQITLVPCTQTLLHFEAYLGSDETPFSQISPAVHAALSFRCTQTSNGGVSLMLRTSAGQIMEWRYGVGSCESVLDEIGQNETTLPAAFIGHNVLITLGTQEWSCSSAQRFLLSNTDESLFLSHCEQTCFSAFEYSSGNNQSSMNWTMCFDPCQRGALFASSLDNNRIRSANWQCVYHEDHASLLILSNARVSTPFSWNSPKFYLVWRYQPIECDDLLRIVFSSTRSFTSTWLAHDVAFSTQFYNFSQTASSRELSSLSIVSSVTFKLGSGDQSNTATIVVLVVLSSLLCIGLAAIAACFYVRVVRGRDTREIRLTMYEMTHEQDLGEDDEGHGGVVTTEDDVQRHQQLKEQVVQVEAERQDQKERNDMRETMQKDKSWLYTDWNVFKAKYSKVFPS